MACRISELVIDAADPGRLAAFSDPEGNEFGLLRTRLPPV
jgi:predicted enzyme related to lactoylglutathione lyase